MFSQNCKWRNKLVESVSNENAARKPISKEISLQKIYKAWVFIRFSSSIPSKGSAWSYDGTGGHGYFRSKSLPQCHLHNRWDPKWSLSFCRGELYNHCILKFNWELDNHLQSHFLFPPPLANQPGDAFAEISLPGIYMISAVIGVVLLGLLIVCCCCCCGNDWKRQGKKRLWKAFNS